MPPIDFSRPEVFVGGLLGAGLIYLFSGLTMKAVGDAAGAVVVEVRRQFKERPGILAGRELPDYGRCVRIVTEAGNGKTKNGAIETSCHSNPIIFFCIDIVNISINVCGKFCLLFVLNCFFF